MRSKTLQDELGGCKSVLFTLDPCDADYFSRTVLSITFSPSLKIAINSSDSSAV